jgi:NADP-dependent 3-hydroxy acid dehydrogenase YdfG
MAARPLAGRHALVTGAGRGIGAAIAERLAAEGARVTLVARSERQLQETAAPLGDAAQCIAADMTDVHAVSRGFQAAAESFGPVDILINNAGKAQSAPLQRTS